MERGPFEVFQRDFVGGVQWALAVFRSGAQDCRQARGLDDFE